jgi:uncharacterized membrane protein
MLHRWFDLIVIGAATLVAVAVGLLVPGARGTWSSIVWLICLAPLVLAWPGYAVAAALFPPGTVGVAERFVLTIAFSLAVVCLGGFVLNMVPGWMRSAGWLPWLAIITLAASGIAALRRGHAEPDGLAHPLRMFRVRHTVLIGLAVVVVVGAFYVSRAAAARQQASTFTQLWIVPSSSGAPSDVQVGIYNEEGRTMRYRLQLVSGNTVVREWAQLELTPRQRWMTTVALPATRSRQDVAGLLYRLDTPATPYRRVLLRGDSVTK